MSLDAMKLALEALEEIADEVFSPYDNKLGDAILAIRAAIEQSEKHEPVAWMYVNTDGECEQIEYSKDEPIPDDPSVTRLYAAPRQWQGLTEEEIQNATQAMDAEPLAEGWSELVKFARSIEAKLKEKNT
jgi:hypothetical protein